MFDMDMPPANDPTVQAAHKLATTILPMLFGVDSFAVACSFGWLLGQIVKDDTQLNELVDAVKDAGEASLWAREDNGHV